jgi:hypothetical protein
MPAIARGVRHSGAEFYWHLGDFRAIYLNDEDMSPPAQLGLTTPRQLSRSEYLSAAWPDFIDRQIEPFGKLPVFLGIGNHETTPPATREKWLVQFADWLDKPVLREQRLRDDPSDQKMHSYNHWISRNVDFISLDNATPDQFDAAQMQWLRAVLHRDETSSQIRTIVVGMHAALPGSIGHIHSMSESSHGDRSGRDAYRELWQVYSSTHKRVYVLASHSHFYMERIFETSDWKDKELPGWIIGTAGAVRYRLPPETGPAQKALTDVYGYMLGTVDAQGEISFTFQKLSQDDLFISNEGRYPEPLVRWCFGQNRQL